MSELSHEDVQRILAIIDSIGDRTVSFEYGDIKLHMTRSGDVAAGAASSGQPPAPVATPAAGGRPGAVAASTPVAAPALPEVTPGRRDHIPETETAKAAVPEGMIAVTAPTSGTFYHAASPAAQPFVKVGDHVEANDTVGVFDVMKLFMSLRAGVSGTVSAILVENQAVAEQGQPLVLIRPD